MEQYNLFDYMDINDEIHINPVEFEPKLYTGQEVYLVNKADIKKYRVDDEKPWNCGKYLGYRLYDGIGWSCTYDTDIGVKTFTDIKTAKAMVDKWCQKYDVILAEDIEPIEIKAWHFFRECDNREMIAYYGILADGKVYIKEYMIYAHINDYKTIDKARKAISKIFNEEEYVEQNVFEYSPKYRNMYPCRNDSGWQWVEAECNYSMTIEKA